ncbi:MAG: LytTR family DNA-binding domain-containing protein, partial [Pseudomonadota bacterium]
PLWLVCSLGVLLSCVFVGPYASFVSYLFKSYWSLGGEGAMIGSVANNPLLESLTQVVRAVVFWTAANYVFDRLLDYPRFRNEDASKNANPPNTSAFANMKDTRSGLLHRLNRIGALSDIIVVKAEEHYVRLYSEHDEELVAFSFGMAVKDLYGEDGFQVHRSHWVRRDAVLRVQDNGLRLTLEMKNGSVIPVSRPYHALIRQVL